MSYPEGTRVGPYEILHPLGAGGMGEVYRARDTKLGRDVALKILPDAFARDPDRRARFEREAQILASLNHPNIAAIYGVEDAAPAGASHVVRALVLELVEGPTLSEKLLFAAMPFDDALPIARQIVEALDAAHAQGVVHRDLKPANIKLRPDGTVKVLDFGLARLVDPATAGQTSLSPESANSPTITSPALTRLGVILGTAAYMAPEQARGRQADKRADIWAFGCVLFEMLAGRRAFHGDTVSDTLASVLRSEPDWTALPPDTPEPIRRLLRRCLAKDLQTRLSDIGVARLEIADALAAPVAAPEPRAVVPAPRSRRGFVPLLTAVGILLVALLSTMFWQARQPQGPQTSVRFMLAPPPGAKFPTATTRSSLAVSPDGRLIAFRAYRPGELAALWIRPLDALEARELKGTLDAQMPFWSPDSRALAFFADGKLKKIDVESGAVQTLCDAPGAIGGAWGSDGTIIVGHAAGGLSRVSSAGGQPSGLTTPDASRKETHHVLPAFLPGGRRFLYTAFPGSTVYVGSLDSDARTPIMEVSSGVQYLAPGYLVFGRQGTVLAQRFDAGTTALGGEPVPVAERVQTVAIPEGGSMTLFSVSGSGVLVYEGAVDEPGGTPVWVARDGRELGPVNPALGTVEFPRFSPDGKRLALVVNRDLWVDDLQGRPPIRLTFDGATSRHYTPLWTPDGARIVYETVSPSPLRSIPADASSTAADEITPAGHFHPFGWSRDGLELLAVEIRPPDTNIVAFTLADQSGSVPRPVVQTPGNDGGAGAALSPDGRWLAYASNATGRQEVWVRPYPGPGAPVRISPNGGDEPVWARDGRELFYLEVNTLMSVKIERGEQFRYAAPVKLYEAEYLRGGQPPTYDVSGDGRFVRLKAPAGQEPGNQPLGVVLNWLDELTRRRP